MAHHSNGLNRAVFVGLLPFQRREHWPTGGARLPRETQGRPGWSRERLGGCGPDAASEASFNSPLQPHMAPRLAPSANDIVRLFSRWRIDGHEMEDGHIPRRGADIGADVVVVAAEVTTASWTPRTEPAAGLKRPLFSSFARRAWPLPSTATGRSVVIAPDRVCLWPPSPGCPSSPFVARGLPGLAGKHDVGGRWADPSCRAAGRVGQTLSEHCARRQSTAAAVAPQGGWMCAALDDDDDSDDDAVVAASRARATISRPLDAVSAAPFATGVCEAVVCLRAFSMRWRDGRAAETAARGEEKARRVDARWARRTGLPNERGASAGTT
jgi:hypothetical protein